jgi:hypothetical protein
MTVYHHDWIRSPFDILEQLNYENPSVVCSYNHAREIRGHVKRLICNFFILIEEAMLMSRKVVFRNELIQIQNAIWVSIKGTVALI